MEVRMPRFRRSARERESCWWCFSAWQVMVLALLLLLRVLLGVVRRGWKAWLAGRRRRRRVVLAMASVVLMACMILSVYVYV
jgi:hypothetical protein